MQMKSFSKKFLAVASAAVLAISASATGISALTASAGVMTGEGTFEEGKGLPWHICESATASMAFDITDGIYAVHLAKVGGASEGGESRWDCQFRHRNLTIEGGHTYRLTFSINASNAGTFYTKIGDMNDDQYEAWHFNGTVLNMTYNPGIDQTELEKELRAASTGSLPTGSGVTSIDYGTGWNYFQDNEKLIPQANKWYCYSFEFSVGDTNSNHTSTETGEWTFHIGGDGDYTNAACFPDDTIVLFDNLMLIDMTSDADDYVAEAEVEPKGVDVNQVGYYPNAIKQATLNLGDSKDSTVYSYDILNASGNVVYSGATSGEAIYDPDSWTYNQIIDFTDFTTEGHGYTISVNNGAWTSYDFDIDSKLYADYDESGNDLLTYALNYFYQARSGITTEDAYIPSPQTVSGSSKTLGREDCHMPDTAYIADEWVYIYESMPSYSKSIDCNGGWYDAGDYGKYVVNGGISLWTLMNMYERSIMTDQADKWGDPALMVLPQDESNNSTPNILDECKYELDFFLEMQRDDGMVYHKMHDYKWTGLAVAPYDDDGDPSGSKRPLRIVKPVTFAATLNFAAACAQGSRLFEPYDSSYASDLLTAAKKAYNAAVEQYYQYTDEQGSNAANWKDSSGNCTKYAPIKEADKGGGGYGDTEVSDEFYWAACELYITTGDSTYKTELEKYGTGAYASITGGENAKAYEVSTSLYGGENEGTFTPFTWGTLNSVGTLSLYVNGESMVAKGLLSNSEYQTICDNVVAAADVYYAEEFASDSAYGTPYHGYDYDVTVWNYVYDGTSSGYGYDDTFALSTKGGSGGYEWGSNSMVINNAIVMALAYDETGETKYIDGVTTALDYLFGRNSISQSYITGYGENSTKYPHHRWWSGQLDSTDFPYAPYGVLSGGPNSNMNDPMVQGRGYKIGYIAPMECYLDNVEAWSVNECTVNWNAPLCWVISFVDDEGPNIVRDDDGTTKTTTTTTTASDADATTTTTTTTATNATTTTTTTTNTTTTKTTTTNTTTTKTTTTTPASGLVDVENGDLLLGDANLDGQITMADAVVIGKIAGGIVNANTSQEVTCDCFVGDGAGINGSDMTSLLRFVVGSISNLPEQA